MIIELLIIFGIPIFLVLLTATLLAHIFFRIPYVPSRQKVVSKMIEAADLKAKDVVYDLGCGDGRLLIAAEKQAKVRATGFEIAPLVYLLAIAKKWLTRSSFSIKFKNLYTANLKKADVIFCYLFPHAMEKLAIKIRKECRKGTRIICHTFHLPSFKPTKIIKRNRKLNLPTIYMYKVQ